MLEALPLFPERASTLAGSVDALYFFLIGVSAFFTLLIASLLLYFSVRYRKRLSPVAEPTRRPTRSRAGLLLEAAWTVIPLLLTGVMFSWGATLYFDLHRPPADALDVYAVGKQWMWKFQHASGQREINELHVPVGSPVRVTLTSEDVIHSFFVPAFRVKRDAVPGMYTVAWFEATKVGRYHLFCAEYCGTKHSAMIGSVVVQEPAEFQEWLSGMGSGESLAAAGQRLFHDLACHTCHRPDSLGRGPVLDGLFGRSVVLAQGAAVVADEAYIRESILEPGRKVVAGFQPIMPAFRGLVDEEALLQLVAYVKSLPARPGESGVAPPQAGAPTPGPAPLPPTATPERSPR